MGLLTIIKAFATRAPQTPETKLYHESAKLVIWKVGATVLGFGISVLLARQLQVEDRGEIAIVLLSLALITMLVQAGVPEAILGKLGRLRTNEEREGLRALVCQYAGTIAVLFFFIALSTQVTFVGSPLNFSIVTSMTGSAMILCSFCRHIMLGDGNLSDYRKSILIEPVSYLFFLIMFFSISDASVNNVLVPFMLSQLLVFIFCSTKTTNFYAWTPNGYRLKGLREFDHLFGENKNFLTIGIGGFLSARLVLFFIEAILGIKAVGKFTVAGNLPNLFSGLVQQVSTIVYSEAANNPTNLGVKVAGISMLYVCLVVVAAAAMYAMGDSLLPAIFGDEYRGLEDVVALLIVVAGASGTNSILINFMAGKGASHVGAKATMLLLIVLAPASILLTQRYDLVGAAFAMLLASLAVTLFLIGKLHGLRD